MAIFDHILNTPTLRTNCITLPDVVYMQSAMRMHCRSLVVLVVVVVVMVVVVAVVVVVVVVVVTGLLWLWLWLLL